MSGPLVSASAAFVAKNSRIPPFAIEQSLRFNSADSAYMERTFSSAGNRQTWTYSCWFKHGNHNQQQTLWSAGTTFGVYDYINFSSNSGTYKDFLEHYIYAIGNYYRTSSVYRDDSAWYHVVIVWDTTNATAADRLRQYINGVRIDAYSVAPTITQNTNSSYINTAVKHRFGLRADSNTSYTGQLMDGYMAEVNFIDGTAVDPEGNLGEFDDNGVWRPIKYTGSYGSNGVYLKFDPSATNGIGHDHSGNGNNFTATGFTTSGTGTDVMSDTPTTNYATLNPLWNPIQATYAEGNLKFTGGSEHSPSASSISASSGKYYFEAKALSGSAAKWSLGIIDTAIGYRKSSGNNYIPGLNPTSIYSAGDAISLYNNNIYKNGSSIVSGVFSGGAVAAGDVVQMAVDIDAGKIWFGIDGTWNNGGGTEGAFNPSGHDATFAANDNYIFHFTAENCGWTVNFGQRDFEQTVPTGFKPLNTANLPAPTVKDGSKYFGTLLYTADNSSGKTVTGLNFGAAPDFVWIKNRDNVESHHLMDIVRGNDAFLFSNNTNQEQDKPLNDTNDTTDFDFVTDGFSFVSTNYNQGELYFNNRTYVGWNWLAGGSGSNNTAGSITSTVSANPTAGFSIVSYTGTGANATVGHGLGVAPKMIIVKDRDASVVWAVHHSDINIDNYLRLNTTDSEVAGLAVWNQTAPTSTVFSIGTSTIVNNTNDYVAYCFAEVEGYSKFGSYTGNDNADGPFVYTGFKPAWLMVKSYSSGHTYNWVVLDAARNTYNVMGNQLFPNLSNQESTGVPNTVDFLSNGFKFRAGGNGHNGSSVSYIYAAFAENPFGGSGVSPATAR